MTADALVARTRDRAHIHRFRGHSAVARHLENQVVASGSTGPIGDLVVAQDRLDGYVQAQDLLGLTKQFQLERDQGGTIILRSTSFDITQVAEIAAGAEVLGALDLLGRKMSGRARPGSESSPSDSAT